MGIFDFLIRKKEEIKKINKLLIANRGEIAVRIIRTCKDLDIETVAIYTTIDRKSLHVRLADYAYCVGEDYLDQNKIIEIAKKANVDAIHPGYGFLSENADFAKKVIENGFIYIGSNPESIRLLGDKISAKQLALKVGLPLIQGTKEPIKSKEELFEVVDKIGLPVILKSANAGGGRGIRIIKEKEKLEREFELAVKEAEENFGETKIFVEKYLENPKHIEIQIAADNYGNVVYLFERDCSIQRRNQKIIEEAPSTILDENLRNKMGKLACKLIKEANYTNLATVEFLVDKDKNFYFLEVNTRIQVEHPVTELITNLDLVALQLLIAEGNKLPFSQKDLKINGHSIEVRIYAEDVDKNFAPSSGKIEVLRLPEGPYIRNDSGIYYGDTVQIFYDSMISKLIVWGRNRAEAIKRLQRSLEEYKLEGVKNNISFLKKIIESEEFEKGDFGTLFLNNFNYKEHKKYEDLAFKIAALLFYYRKNKSFIPKEENNKEIRKVSRWKQVLKQCF